MRIRFASLWVVVTTLGLFTLHLRADESHIADEIAGLGDAAPAKRDAAAEALWAMGRAAEPALEAATNSDDPEIAERAHAILERLRFGLSSTSPPVLAKMLAQYRGGNEAQRREAVAQLAGQNVAGMRVLAGLLHGASNANDRDLILKVMGGQPRQAAALLIVNGDRDAAEHILSDASEPGGDEAARDLAAFEIFSGGLAAKIDAIKSRLAEKDVPSTEVLLATLQRAAGDLPAARAAAEKSGNEQVADDILVEQREWAELAHRLAARADLGGPLEGTGYLAYCQHLAGDTHALGETLRAISAFADSHRNAAVATAAARTLCLCGEVDTAIDLLVKQSEFDLAAQIQIHRLKLREAMVVLRAGEKAPPKVRLRLRLRAVEIATMEGKKDLVAANFAEAVRLARTLNDAESWGLIAHGARGGADPARADEYVARMLALCDRASRASVLLAGAGVPNAPLAEKWWWFLRPRVNGADLMPAARRVVALAGERAPSAKLVAFAGEMQSAAEQFPNRATLTSLAAQTLVAAGDAPGAESYLSRKTPDLQMPDLFVQLAGAQELQGKWTEAAANYDRAWEMDRTQAAPLLLEGLALRHTGNSAEAQRLIDLAHWLPLADDAARLQLIGLCESHGADADAARERDLLTKTGDVHGRELLETWGSAGALAVKEHKDDALGLLQSAMVALSTGRFALTDEVQVLRIAAVIDTLHAGVALRAGAIQQALLLAERSETIEPGSSDEFLELIAAFAQSGHPEEANVLRSNAAKVLTNLLAEFPDGPLLENNLAWLLAKSGGNLTVALTHALHAAQLDPHSAAIADTLAEVYFRQGELGKAVEAMQKCVVLAPNRPREQKRLEQFQAALANKRSQN